MPVRSAYCRKNLHLRGKYKDVHLNALTTGQQTFCGCEEEGVTMLETVLLLAIAVPSVLMCVLLYWLGRVRRRETLFRWASLHGYRLLSFGQPILSE